MTNMERYKFAKAGNAASAAKGSAMIYDDVAGLVIARTAGDMLHMAPLIVAGMNYCDPLAKALESILKAYNEPNYGDLAQTMDSLFDAITASNAHELLTAYRAEVPAVA